MYRLLKISLILALFAAAWLGFDAWSIPLEARARGAAEAAAGDPWAVSEAASFAEAQWGLLRAAAPLAFLLSLAALFCLEALVNFLKTATRGLRSAIGRGDDQSSRPALWLMRGFLAAWLIVALSQAGAAVVQRLKDWHAYRLHDGHISLPNISPTNRQVIRYVASATPPDARILVLSDQKLFFLSYYLLPRRLYHPLHPDSEFVIPLAHGERQLAAYTRDDLDPQYLKELNPDYVLEYFEGDAYVDPQRTGEDTAWLRFLGGGTLPPNPPNIFVRLRPYHPGEAP